jgi:hypothetical protein
MSRLNALLRAVAMPHNGMSSVVGDNVLSIDATEL